MAQPLAATLAARGWRNTLLAPAWALPLADLMPGVSAAIESPFPHGRFGWSARRALARSLPPFDRAIVLPNSWKSALVPFFAGIPLRTGYRGEWRHGLLNDIRLLDKDALPKLADRYHALAQPAGEAVEAAPFPRLEVPSGYIAAVLARFELDPGKPAVAFCPGAEYGPAKRWPAAHFADLGKKLIDSGYQVWLVGGPGDLANGEEIAALAPGCRQLCGATTLTEAAALIATTRLAVTNDSGLMHVAAALGVPVLALFGSSSPRYTPPLSAQARVLSLNLSCSPCFRRDCPLGTTACLQGLSASVAWEAAQAMLDVDSASTIVPKH